MNTLWTLILVTHITGTEVVTMHDFPSLQSCQKAAQIAKDLMTYPEYTFKGARCLKVSGEK